MSGQIICDLRHAADGKWSDKKTWAAKGPGSQRGLRRYLGHDNIRSKMKDDEFQEGLSELITNCRESLPVGITRRLEAIDYQNCLCEYDKYCRALHGEGKPKQIYYRS